MARDTWTLFTCPGYGSAIAEAALTVAGVPFVREVLNLDDEKDRERLRAVNPLGQLPTARLPDGTVLTESAAIALVAADVGRSTHLAPAPTDPERTTFLRWLVFYVAAVYPTFVYGDVPTRWTDAPDSLRASTDAKRQQLLLQLEGAARGPWFLGERRSALDLFAAVMVHWRPGRAWYAEHAPKLAAIAARTAALPELTEVFATNFPG